MNIPNFIPLSHSEVPDAPKWAEKLMGPVYDQIHRLTQMAQHQISISDNLNQEPRELEATHDTDFDLTAQQLRGKPIGASLIFADFYEKAYLFHKILDIKTVRCRVQFNGAQPGEKHLVRILLLGS